MSTSDKPGTDWEKFANDLLDSPFGDLARERFLDEIVAELGRYTTRFNYGDDEARREADREWAEGVAEWLNDNFR